MLRNEINLAMNAFLKHELEFIELYLRATEESRKRMVAHGIVRVTSLEAAQSYRNELTDYLSVRKFRAGLGRPDIAMLPDSLKAVVIAELESLIGEIRDSTSREEIERQRELARHDVNAALNRHFEDLRNFLVGWGGRSND